MTENTDKLQEHIKAIVEAIQLETAEIEDIELEIEFRKRKIARLELDLAAVRKQLDKLQPKLIEVE